MDSRNSCQPRISTTTRRKIKKNLCWGGYKEWEGTIVKTHHGAASVGAGDACRMNESQVEMGVRMVAIRPRRKWWQRRKKRQRWPKTASKLMKRREGGRFDEKRVWLMEGVKSCKGAAVRKIQRKQKRADKCRGAEESKMAKANEGGPNTKRA